MGVPALFAHIRLFAECVSEEVAVAVAGEDHRVAGGIFGNIQDRESSVCFYIGFRADGFHFDQLLFGVLLATAGIDILNKNFVFVHDVLPYSLCSSQ